MCLQIAYVRISGDKMIMTVESRVAVSPEAVTAILIY